MRTDSPLQKLDKLYEVLVLKTTLYVYVLKGFITGLFNKGNVGEAKEANMKVANSKKKIAFFIFKSFG
jgi:hypothetical protein